MSKFKKGDRVKVSVDSEYSPQSINGAIGTVTNPMSWSYVEVDLDNERDTYLFYERELSLVKFSIGDRITVTKDHNVRIDGAISVKAGDVGTVGGDTPEGNHKVNFDHLDIPRYISPKYIQKVPHRQATPQDDRRIAMDRLINAGLLTENGDTRLGLMGIAAFVGADTSETGDKVIAALLGH